MRLSEFEQKIIKQTAGQFFGEKARVYLFGSRANDSLRGGDIDIYIETKNTVENLLDRKLHLLVKLEKKIGEQQIDVVINDGAGSKKTIYQIALTSGILL